MIRILCHGGLGNQLFIWSMAHDLSKTFDERIRIIYVEDGPGKFTRPIEIRPLMNYCPHNIEITKSRILGLVFRINDKLEGMILKKINPIPFLFGLVDFQDAWSSTLKTGKKPRLLRGFFHNMSLVDRTRKEVNLEIISYVKAVDNELKISNKFNLEKKAYETLHVRRGDYMFSAQTTGLISLSYYQKNMSGGVKSVIATDDHEYLQVLKNEFRNSLILDPNIFDAWETFTILSNSKKLVMANSTFSWWVGQIVIQNEGTVIAPEPWFKNLGMPKDYLYCKKFVYSASEFEIVNLK